MSGFGRSSAKRRRRRPPQAFSASSSSAGSLEERLLRNAIQNSKLDKGRPPDGKLKDVPMGPVFYPSQEDFEGNPLDYVNKIRPVAEKYGICKIVPPPGWNPPFAVDFDSQKRFETKLQCLHRLQEGIAFGDGLQYTAAEYQREVSQRAKQWKATHYPDHDLISRHSEAIAKDQKEGTPDAASDKTYTVENLERDYWNIVETHSQEVHVEYGNDVDTAEYGSGFPLSERGRSIAGTINVEKVNDPEEPRFGTEDYYKETWWNLNNIPRAPDSVLRHVRLGLNGINVPWMYYGSLFSTFCWHNEDNYLYSINYHHRGAPKVWYGVPGSKIAADGLEKVFKQFLSMRVRDIPDLMHHITTMFSPRLLRSADVPVFRIVQHQGEFVLTFPRSFHGGFSLGPNVGEAVNFATHDWIALGADANERYRSFSRPAVFSHDRLAFTMANHLEDQTSFSTCKLLLADLERIVAEELQLRHKLLSTGVRDVSDIIRLPPNVLGQLDEKSASYDDKRLCHSCKHVCFFSAVACECSQSKVSCLRHSQYMCVCPPSRRYFMLWAKEEELKSTLGRVRKHCELLKNAAGADADKADVIVIDEDYPEQAPGSQRDLLVHKNDSISTDPVTTTSALKLPAVADKTAAQVSSGTYTPTPPDDINVKDIFETVSKSDDATGDARVGEAKRKGEIRTIHL